MMAPGLGRPIKLNNEEVSISVVDRQISFTVLFAVFQFGVYKMDRLSYKWGAITGHRDRTKRTIGRKTSGIYIEIRN